MHQIWAFGHAERLVRVENYQPPLILDEETQTLKPRPGRQKRATKGARK